MIHFVHLPDAFSLPHKKNTSLTDVHRKLGPLKPLGDPIKKFSYAMKLHRVGEGKLL